MFLTSKSEKNILYILQNYKKYINIDNKTIHNHNVLKKLFDLLQESDKISKKIKHKLIETDDIENINKDIYSLNSSKFLPEQILDYLNENLNYKFTYVIYIDECNIELNFYSIINEQNSLNKTKKYINNYLKLIKSWIFICNLYSKNKLKNLKLQIFFTPFVKKIPDLNNLLEKYLLSSFNVNSGYTQYNSTSNDNKNIVIYRKEEWFKVLIHETLHAFNLDFNDINLNKYIGIFKNEFNFIESDFNFNESYCEFWANIMNLCYYCYDYSKGNFRDFIISFEINITMEKMFSIMQLNKILNYYDLNYEMITSKTNNQMMRHIYKEQTNVFCYYILKSILIFNYEKVFLWCNKNNLNFIQFKSREKNINDFMKLIFKLKENKKFKKILMETNDKINNNNLEMCLFEYVA
tara:strand:+ start:3446 stop:4669 length:1224 start_codon:yes stop_codon:yes gene_type:complete